MRTVVIHTINLVDGLDRNRFGDTRGAETTSPRDGVFRDGAGCCIGGRPCDGGVVRSGGIHASRQRLTIHGDRNLRSKNGDGGIDARRRTVGAAGA